jgi:L-lactate dehydrogenase complex protein LldF
MANGNLKNKVVNSLFKGWTKHRADLNFSEKTFNETWKEQRGRSKKYDVRIIKFK